MSQMKIDDRSTSPVIAMEREFDAPIELVWAALTDPAQVVRWYGGHGFTNPVCEMDVRPGGRWHHVMRTPDGHEFPADFEFVEVAPPTTLVWRPVDHGHGGPHDCTVRVELETLGARTRWRMTATFHSLVDRDAANAIGFAHVLAQGCERFAALLGR